MLYLSSNQYLLMSQSGPAGFKASILIGFLTFFVSSDIGNHVLLCATEHDHSLESTL